MAMIVFRTPKAGPDRNLSMASRSRHLARAPGPIADMNNPEHLRQLEEWMKSYRAHELFDQTGKFRDEFAVLAPTGHRRMGSNPHANGGELLFRCRCLTSGSCYRNQVARSYQG